MKTPIATLRVDSITDLVTALIGEPSGFIWSDHQRRAYNRAIRHAKKREESPLRDMMRSHC